MSAQRPDSTPMVGNSTPVLESGRVGRRAPNSSSFLGIKHRLRESEKRPTALFGARRLYDRKRYVDPALKRVYNSMLNRMNDIGDYSRSKAPQREARHGGTRISSA